MTRNQKISAGISNTAEGHCWDYWTKKEDAFTLIATFLTCQINRDLIWWI